MKCILSNIIFYLMIFALQVLFVFGPMDIAILTGNKCWYWLYVYIPVLWIYDICDGGLEVFVNRQ